MDIKATLTIDISPALEASLKWLTDAVKTLYKTDTAGAVPGPCPECPLPVVEVPKATPASITPATAPPAPVAEPPKETAGEEPMISNEDMKLQTDMLLTKLTGDKHARQSTEPRTVAIVKQSGRIFKEIAAKISEREKVPAKKPTDLPGHLRPRFMEAVEKEIYIHEDGTVIWRPF